MEDKKKTKNNDRFGGQKGEKRRGKLGNCEETNRLPGKTGDQRESSRERNRGMKNEQNVMEVRGEGKS